MRGGTAGVRSRRRVAIRLAAAISRATPAMQRQSPRFGVSPTSMTTSSSASHSARSAPSGAPAPRSRIPSASSPSSSSRAEHSMPCETSPRIRLLRIFDPSGSRAPGRAKAARMPGRTLGAPHTTRYTSPPPSATSQSRSLSAPGCGATPTISATVTRLIEPATGVADSTSRPIAVSRAASSSVSIGGSTHSRTHRSLNFMPDVSASYPNCFRNLRSFSKNDLRSSTP